ncbi:MAG: carbamoyl-phosphate synthase [Polyangiaceae bacterium]
MNSTEIVETLQEARVSAPARSGDRPSPSLRAAPSFVLTSARAFGTLAAARCLGDHKVPVVLVDAERFAPAAWSRHVALRESCPPIRPIGRFIDSLLAFGSREPGHVLYATCDDLAWTFAERQAELGKYFRLFTPPFETIAQVLDKRALYAACAAVGLDTPRTWFPETDEEVSAVARSARMPLIVKPRTQAFFTSSRKGFCVTSSAELGASYSAFARDNVYEPGTVARDARLWRPMIQALCEDEPIYSVSGFCDPRRDLFVARGSRKMLQWPRRAGVGIAFESAPLDRRLAEGTRRLCEATGFFGVFEAEFVDSGHGMQLIDFNPRFFGQLGFDVARGLPSPHFVYLAATEGFSELEDAVERANAWQAKSPIAFHHSAMIAWTRAVERLVGRSASPMPPGADGRDADVLVVDAAADPADCLPGLVDAVQQICSALLHPRAALRSAARGYS